MKKLLLAGLIAASAFGAQVTLDISGGVNGTLQDLTGVFPEGTITNAGITFAITPSTGHNYWNAILSSDEPPQLAVPVNLTGVTHIYSLINTVMGVSGPPALASVTLFATDSSFLTFNLLGDSDFRSYADGIYTNTINNSFPTLPGTYGTVNWFSGNDGVDVRLDALVLALPSEWSSKTLSLIMFEDDGANDTQRIFVSGVTAETADTPTPEPATFSLVLGAGLVALGLRRRG